MSNILLAYSNRADAATPSGGSWNAGFPLINLKDGNISKVARSTNALAASTLFAVDLGASYSLRAIALVNHNLSTAATVRFRTSNVGALPAAATNHDSGTVNALRLTFQGDTPTAWGSKYLVQDVFDAVTARYLYVEVTDTANAAGYVEIGRLFVGGGLQPAKNASWGLKSGRKALDSITTSVSGKRYGMARRRPRVEQFALNWLTQAEADRIHEMQDEVGLCGEVLYVPDPADAAFSQRYGCLANLTELGAIDWPLPLTRAVPFQIEEIL